MQLPVVDEVSANTDIALCITVTAINATCVGFSGTPFACVIPGRRNTKWWFILNYCKRTLHSDHGYIYTELKYYKATNSSTSIPTH